MSPSRQTLRKIARAPKVVKDLMDHPINRRQKVAALARFVRWQLGSRILGKELVHRWVAGTRFVVQPGEAGLTGNVYAGLHEFEEMAFLLHLLDETSLFVDVGANSGSYTLLAAGVAGAQAIAFEPIPETRQRLATNVRLNGLQERVRILPKGVGAEPGVVSFTTSHDCKNHVATAEERDRESTITVEVTTLDEALKDLDPTLIKLDVEGYELPVLQGATRTLDRPSLQALIVEINRNLSRYGFEGSAVYGYLARHGFLPHSYDPFRRKLTEIPPGRPETRPWSDNVLFVRNPEAVERRLASAPQITVYGVSI